MLDNAHKYSRKKVNFTQFMDLRKKEKLNLDLPAVCVLQNECSDAIQIQTVYIADIYISYNTV